MCDRQVELFKRFVWAAQVALEHGFMKMLLNKKYSAVIKLLTNFLNAQPKGFPAAGNGDQMSSSTARSQDGTHSKGLLLMIPEIIQVDQPIEARKRWK